MVKVEAILPRESVEAVIEAVEEQAGHVGVTVVDAVGHGNQRVVTHAYRGQVFESRYMPKALLVFVVDDESAQQVVDVVLDTLRGGTDEAGVGIVWTTRIENVALPAPVDA